MPVEGDEKVRGVSCSATATFMGGDCLDFRLFRRQIQTMTSIVTAKNTTAPPTDPPIIAAVSIVSPPSPLALGITLIITSVSISPKTACSQRRDPDETRYTALCHRCQNISRETGIWISRSRRTKDSLRWSD